MKLAFSSLSCPSCDVDALVRMALRYGFEGVELRTIQNTINLWELPDFAPEALAATCCKFKQAGLEVLVVGTSVSFAKTGSRQQRKTAGPGKKIQCYCKRA